MGGYLQGKISVTRIFEEGYIGGQEWAPNRVAKDE